MSRGLTPKTMNEPLNDGKDGYKLGDVVSFKNYTNEENIENGTVKFIGYLKGHYKLMIGVEFDNSIGAGSGTFAGEQLFYAKKGHAAFVPADYLEHTNRKGQTGGVSNATGGPGSQKTLLLPVSSTPRVPTAPPMEVSGVAPPTYEQAMQEPSSSVTHPSLKLPVARTMRSLYARASLNFRELQFGVGELFTNVYELNEPGWLIGTLNGETGLIPATFLKTVHEEILF